MYQLAMQQKTTSDNLPRRRPAPSAPPSPHAPLSAYFPLHRRYPQFVLLNLVLAVVLEGASDQMKEKYASQKFREDILRRFHSQYRRLAMRRWAAKVKAKVMLERGEPCKDFRKCCTSAALLELVVLSFAVMRLRCSRTVRDNIVYCSPMRSPT